MATDTLQTWAVKPKMHVSSNCAALAHDPPSSGLTEMRTLKGRVLDGADDDEDFCGLGLALAACRTGFACDTQCHGFGENTCAQFLLLAHILCTYTHGSLEFS